MPRELIDFRAGTPAEHELAQRMSQVVYDLVVELWPPGSCNPSLICSALLVVVAEIVKDAPAEAKGNVVEYLQDYLMQCITSPRPVQ